MFIHWVRIDHAGEGAAGFLFVSHCCLHTVYMVLGGEELK